MKPTTTLTKCLAMALLIAGNILATTNIAAKQTFLVSPDPATERLVLESSPGERDVEYVSIKNVAGFDVLLKIALQPRSTDDIWVFSLPNGAVYKLPANESIRVPVVFKPTAAGRFEDVLSIVDEFGYGVRLKVYGVSVERCILRQPTELKLGPTPVGERACETIQIANPTTGVIVVRDISLEARTDEFSIHEVPELPVRIQPGDYIKIVACYKPTAYTPVEKALVKTTYYCANTDVNADAKVAETILYGIGDENLCRMKVRELIELSVPAGEKVCEKLVVANGNDRTIILGEINLEQNGELGLEDVVELPVRILPGTEMTVGVICYKPDGSMNETKGRINYTYLCENAAHRQYTSTIVHGIVKREHCVLRQTPSVAFRSSPNVECKEVKMANTGDLAMRILDISIVRTTGDWKLRLPDGPIGIEPGEVKSFGICHLPTGASLNSACVVRTLYACANSDQRQEAYTKAYIVAPGTTIAVENTSANVGASLVDRLLPEIQIGMSVSDDRLKNVEIFPNPANSGVTISGSQGASVEIYDMLGRQVIVLQSDRDILWNCRNAGGELVPAGAYIVRISANNAENEPFVISRRLMIDR